MEKDTTSHDENLEALTTWKTTLMESETSGTECKSGSGSRSDYKSKKEALLKRFHEARKKSEEIRHHSALRQQKTEKRRAERLLRKAVKDPLVKALVENPDGGDLKNDEGEEKKLKWQDVKPFLTVNDHLQGPVSHGDCGPKTELETIIDDCLKEGDFEKAEILSDTLANRQFAMKISKAFDAKRYAEDLAKEEALKKAKKMKKLRWGFETKERWQMKGNM